MSAGEVGYSLKEALLETLSSILSPDQEIRKNAEKNLQALEVMEEYGVYLTDLTLDSQRPLAVRQLSSVLLKQYVDTHWTKHAEKFTPPETTLTAKIAIRQMLPHGLQESVSKVRSAVAYAIAAIAHWDWPEEWPDLFNTLMACLTQGNHDAVHGAMRVLTEFAGDLTDNQIVQVAPVILPEIYRIFQEREKYGSQTRARAAEIFTTLSSMICVMDEYQKGLVKTLLGPVILPFTEALVKELQALEGPSSEIALKTVIIKALTVLVKYVPKQLSQWLLQILPAVWNTLTQSAHVYVTTVVNEIDDLQEDIDSDLDGEVISFENLVSSIFDFVVALVDAPRFRSSVQQGMSDIIYYIVLFMQITEEQARTWTTNSDRFVEDESEDSYTSSVRISAQELLMTICEQFEDEAYDGICSAANRHLQEAESAHNSGDPNWWKVVEATLLALGSVKDLLMEQMNKGKRSVDPVAILQNTITEQSRISKSSFLLGRCLWTASRFAAILPEQLLTQYVEATVRALQANQDTVLRLIAIRAICGFCEFLKSRQSAKALVPLLPSITESLLNMALMFTSEVLSLVMETLAIIIAVDKNFTAAWESKITPLTIALFLKHNSDPVVTSLAQDIFKVLSQTEGCLAPLQHRLLPTLISIIESPPNKVSNDLQAVALDVLQTLVRSSHPPLSDALLQAFPAAVRRTMTTDDASTIQNGGECLRAFVSVAADQVASFRDSEGKSGLQYVVQVASHLLSPTCSESSSAFVGRLVSSLLSRSAMYLGDSNIDLLLRAVLSKLQGDNSLAACQSLIMVYARLVHSQMEAVLNFLSTVPGPTGQSALHFVLGEWCGKQHLFYGAYENKVSILALAQLLHHGVTTNDSRLSQITVKIEDTDSMASEEGDAGIQTRSRQRARGIRWKDVSVFVKIFKLLVYELSNAIEAAVVTEDSTDDESGEKQILPDEGARYLSSVLDDNDELNNDEGDDPDAASDPLYYVNLQQRLTEFIQSFCQQPYFAEVFLPHLSLQEKEVLSIIGIRV